MDGENDVCIQITCRFSADNVDKRFQYDLNLNQEETKQHPVIESQFLYTENDSIDKIFHDTIEELNLTRLYLNGYDVTLVKNGKRNVFYEQQDGNVTLKTDKSSTTSSLTGSTSTNDESDGSDSEIESESNGLVHSFIRTIFEDLVSVKDVHYLFSIGWTEINELNQLLDLLNGNGLLQCFSMPQLLEAVAVGLKNKNDLNNHNILSIVLEQQWIDSVSGQPMHKLSTVNFCDFKYGNDKPAIPVEPMNFYSQPMPFLPPNYMFSPPPIPMNFFSPPPMMPTSPDGIFFNSNTPRFDNANALLMQQNQRLLKNAELLFSKLNFNDIDDDRRKEIQEWMYLKTECDNYMSTSSLSDIPPPPSYFNNNSMLPSMAPLVPSQQPSSLLPIIEMDENSTGREDEDETNDDNDSESGSYIDINDQSNNLFQKISDKISNFQDRTDDVVREKSSEYFENNPKVIISSGSDFKPPVAGIPDNICDDGVVDVKISSEQYLATTGRRRSIRENHILSSEELNLIKKAAAATSFEMGSVKEGGVESEQQTKLDELRKALKKSMA